MTDHYAGVAAGWACSAALVYRPLAEDLVAAAPHPLTGLLALDAGAGTGLVSSALIAAGARPIAVDLSLDMLRWRRDDRPPAAVSQVTRIGLRSDAVDAAFAGFVLNHLPDPVAALRELARVTRPGGAVLATVPANSSASAVRDRVDEVAIAHGFRWPEWSLQLRQEWAPRLGTESTMAAAARAAGLEAVAATEYTAELGLDRAEDLVDYRYRQAHCREWISGLTVEQRTELRATAIAAIRPIMEPYRPRVVRLLATAPGPGSAPA
jgi:ubiquinone/menaquinone biosynthesis C-methylase UbiE